MTDTNRASPVIVESFKDFYDRVRKRIVDEDGVINHRMMWGTLAQTAMFAGFGLANFERLEGSRKAVSSTIAYGGISIAVLMFISILAARLEISALAKIYNDNASRMTGYNALLPILSSARKHVFGHLLALGLPVVIIVLWVRVLFALR